MFPLFLLIYEFCAYLSNDMYLPALLAIEQDFQSTKTLSELTITVWYAGMALPQLAFGALSDRFGRRVVLFSGAILFLLATSALALASSMESFLLFRFFEGVSIASLLVSGYAAIHESFDDRKAIQIVAWMGCITVIAPMFGPLLGGYFLQVASWRQIFWFINCSALPAIIALYYCMPETSRLEKQSKGVYLKLLKNSLFVANAIVYGALLSVMIAWIAASPFLLMQQGGLNAIEYGWRQVPIFAAYMLATRLVTPLYDRIGDGRLLMAGVSIIALAALQCLFGGSLILLMATYSFGFGLVSALLNRRVFNSSDEQKGAVTAMFYVIELLVACTITLFLSILPFEFIMISFSIASIIFLCYINNPKRGWIL